MRVRRPRFFIRIQTYRDGKSLKVFLTCVFERVKDGEHTAFTVRAAGALHMVAFAAHGALGRRSVGKYGVKMRVHHHVIVISPGTVGGKKPAAGLGPEINEFGMKAD